MRRRDDAIGTTGLSCSNASRHFVKRLNELGHGGGIAYTSALEGGFSKASLAVDSCHADVSRMTHVINGLAEGGFGISHIVTDRGYDAEHVHVEVRGRLRAEAAIRARHEEKVQGGAAHRAEGTQQVADVALAGHGGLRQEGDFSCGVLGVLAKMAVGGYNEQIGRAHV